MSNDPRYVPPKLANRLQVSIREAAEVLGYKPRTLYRMVARGELPSIGTGRLRRIAVTDLLAWQQRNRQEAA